MPDTYTGRLACDGDGNLLADDGQPVAHDPQQGAYVYVTPGEPSHNERHHKNYVPTTVTSEPLYNAAGELVYPGDPHHDAPTPDDPHFAGLLFHSDEDGPVQTSHTGAYA